MYIYIYIVCVCVFLAFNYQHNLFPKVLTNSMTPEMKISHRNKQVSEVVTEQWTTDKQSINSLKN